MQYSRPQVRAGKFHNPLCVSSTQVPQPESPQPSKNSVAAIMDFIEQDFKHRIYTVIIVQACRV